MSLITSKMLFNGSGIPFGGEGSAYTAEQSVVLAAIGNTSVLPVGDWWLEPNADVNFQFSIDGGTTWSADIPTTGLPFVRSDGNNVRLICVTAATTAKFFGPA